jgi:DNA-binding MarR family transcriptional regulator
MPSDVSLLLRTLPRVYGACRAREVATAGSARSVASDHQVRILNRLDQSDPVMLTELAEAMGVTAATMSVNVRRLAEAGLVSRARDPDDRRVQNVRLTEKGEKVRSERAELDVARVDALLRELPQEARPLVAWSMRALSEAVEALERRPYW